MVAIEGLFIFDEHKSVDLAQRFYESSRLTRSKAMPFSSMSTPAGLRQRPCFCRHTFRTALLDPR